MNSYCQFRILCSINRKNIYLGNQFNTQLQSVYNSEELQTHKIKLMELRDKNTTNPSLKPKGGQMAA